MERLIIRKKRKKENMTEEKKRKKCEDNSSVGKYCKKLIEIDVLILH